MQGDPDESILKRAIRELLTSAVMYLFNALDCLVTLNRGFSTLFTELGDDLLAAIEEMKGFGGDSALLRGQVVAVTINELAFVGFVHEGVDAVQRLFMECKKSHSRDA